MNRQTDYKEGEIGRKPTIQKVFWEEKNNNLKKL